jgi:hypothetical protein
VTSRGNEGQARVISLGRALLDRLRSGLTAGDLVHRSDRLPPVPTPPELDEIFAKLAGGSAVAVESLAFALIAADKSGDADLHRHVLQRLRTMQAGGWLALDLKARKSWRYAPGWTQGLRRRLAESEPGILSLIVGSFHPDGYIREACVAILADSLEIVATHAIAVRTADWVEQVRDRARIAIERRLSRGDPEQLLAAAPIALAMSDRHLGTWLGAMARDRIRTGTEAELLAAIDSNDRRTRRLAFSAAIDRDEFSLERLIAAAGSDFDMVIRRECARAAVVRARAANAIGGLQELLASGTAYVRAEAVAALAAEGELQPAVDALVDRSPMVRFQAQVAVRRAGHEPATNYRNLSRNGYPPPAVIAGIGETGGASDIPDLVAWLQHPIGRGRAEAVRSLRRLNAATIERVGGLLTDSSAAVTRQVMRAVEKDGRKLDAEQLTRLTTREWPRHVRIAAFRLLQEHGAWRRLASDLSLVDDADPTIRTRARDDLDTWVRREAAAQYSRPSGEAAAELRALMNSAESSLSPKLARDLRFHLGLTPSRH